MAHVSLSGEVTLFRNDIGDYIFRTPISADEFAERYGSIDDGEFPYIEFVGADSVLQGFEAHTDIRLSGAFDLELGMDYVRGELKESGEPLPGSRRCAAASASNTSATPCSWAGKSSGSRSRTGSSPTKRRRPAMGC